MIDQRGVKLVDADSGRFLAAKLKSGPHALGLLVVVPSAASREPGSQDRSHFLSAWQARRAIQTPKD